MRDGWDGKQAGDFMPTDAEQKTINVLGVIFKISGEKLWPKS